MKSRHAHFLIVAVALILAGVALTVSPCGCSDGQDSAASGQTTTTTTFKSGTVEVEGLVEYPMTLTDLDLDYMGWFTGEAEHPDLGTIGFEGVRLSEVFWYIGVESEAETLTITSVDGSTMDVALEDMADDAALTVAENGALDMVLPAPAGDTWVTDVVAMEFK